MPDLNHDCIDAHSHVWTSDLSQYPLAEGFSKADVQPASFTPSQLLAEAQPCGVSRVVLIQMSYYGFDNRYMIDAIRQHPGTFAGIAVIDDRSPALLQTMQELKRRGVRGFRIHPGGQNAESWLTADSMGNFWRLAAQERLAICALINPDTLPLLDAMCQRFPETTVVIDHFARIGIDGHVRQSDFDNLARLSRHRQVYVKISAFYALGQKRAPYSDLGPMIRQLRDAFGSQRLMWGTDCPYQVGQGHTYCDSIELVRGRLKFLTVEDRQWLLRKTAEKLFFA